MNIPENILSTLTEEQRKKVEAAKTPEELLALAKEAGYELSDEQLEAVSGGSIWCGSYCSSKNPCPDYCDTYGDIPSCPYFTCNYPPHS